MADTFSEDFLKKLVATWRGKLESAREHRQPWFDVREQCMTFVTGAVGAVWSNDFQEKFLGKAMPVRFKISLNKAFELVAIFGPVLYARNPVRSVNPYRPVQIEPEAFGDPNDPMVQQYVAQITGQQNHEHARNRLRCRLLESYLNYTPQEQPGGLEQAGEDAVTDALLSGLGILFPDSYTMPGSDRRLTGSFYESPVNLLIDPDSRKMDFGKAKWVARRHLDPVWEVERRFNLPKDSLKDKAYIESHAAQASRQASDLGNLDRQRGLTFDQIEWYEIWSIGGVGDRLAGADESLRKAFDKYVGDYAYICVAAGGVPWPLNCPPNKFRQASVENIQERFRWPVPYWMDQRWPFATCQFYRHPDRSWPIAPLSPGLGELTFLNFLITRLANHVWQSTKQFVAVVESAREEIEKLLKRGEDLAVFGIPDMQKNINNLVSFLQYPDLSTDIWATATSVMELFDKRVGLSEIMYAMNVGGVASRTATDVQAKQEKASIRPDHMAKKVEQFMCEAAAMEKLCAFWSKGGVRGQDIQPLLGSVGAGLWDQLFADADPEVVAREMLCTVVSGSAKKRNRSTELAGINQLYQPVSQQLGQYAATTTDTGPLNALNRKLFDALDVDGEGLDMGPMAPPPQQPDPAIEQEAAMEQQRHEQEMAQGQEKHDQEIDLKQAELSLKEAEAAMGMEIQEDESELEMEIKEEEADQAMRLAEMKAKLDARLARMKAAAQARAVAAKPKPQGTAA